MGSAGDGELDGLRGAVILRDTSGAAERSHRDLQLQHIEARGWDEDVDVGGPHGPDDGIEDALAVVGEFPHPGDGPEDVKPELLRLESSVRSCHSLLQLPAGEAKVVAGGPPPQLAPGNFQKVPKPHLQLGVSSLGLP